MEVTVARMEDRDALANMMQLYTHDFSEHWTGTPNGNLQDDGRFAPYPLEAYWRDDEHVPLLFRLDGILTGFALLDRTSHSGQAVGRNIAEFFVARKYRGTGAGRTAADMIFRSYPGVWEAAVARRNVGALAFWRAVVADHPQARDMEELDITNAQWNGPVIRFRIEPNPPATKETK